MPGQKPQSVSTDLSLGRALLRAIALKMAGWSNAILKKLATDNPAASPDPTVDAADVRTSVMDNDGFAGPVISHGPPMHWIERVRQGAPELLRPAPRPGNRPTTPAPDASAIAPPAAEGKESPLQAEATSASKPTGPKPPARRLERPADPSEKKESNYLDPPPTRPIRPTSAARSIHSIESRESRVAIPASATRAEPAFTTGLPHEEETWPRPDPAEFLSPSPQSTKRVRPTKSEHSRPPSEILRDSRVPSEATLPSSPPQTQSGQEVSEDQWPELPEIPSDVSNDPKSLLRERERLQRLDDEQRGIYGARRILA